MIPGADQRRHHLRNPLCGDEDVGGDENQHRDDGDHAAFPAWDAPVSAGLQSKLQQPGCAYQTDQTVALHHRGQWAAQRPRPADAPGETGHMPEADPPEPASSEAAPEPCTVIIGVISAPGTSTELAERLRPDLTERIGWVRGEIPVRRPRRRCLPLVEARALRRRRPAR